jgi:hypothetical protein
MKKSILTLSFVVLAASATGAMAAGKSDQNYGPGCGLGQQIWHGQTGLLAHTSAGTTNGTSYNQWFGISSGTLGCKDNSVVQNDYERKLFVASNLDTLAQEAAQGQGAHLASLADLMGVKASDKAAFYSLTQAHYASVFAADHSDSTQVLAALDSAMQGDAQLAQYIR